MKPYFVLIFLGILITACAPTIEVEKAQTPEVVDDIQVPPEPQELEIPEEPTPETTENIIEILETSFKPAEKTITQNTEIKWIKKDSRKYKLACYLDGTRIVLSPDLLEGDSFTYTFLKDGKYTCITTPYGLRNIINVESQPFLSPTGSAIQIGDDGIKRASFAGIAMIGIMIGILFIYRKKK